MNRKMGFFIFKIYQSMNRYTSFIIFKICQFKYLELKALRRNIFSRMRNKCFDILQLKNNETILYYYYFFS